MTLVSQIISDAFRVSNLIALGTSPTASAQTEALRYLNRLVVSSLGYEAGEGLVDFQLGGENIVRPAGYPEWGNSPGGEWFIPDNTRLVLNLTSASSVYLAPNPQNGARFGLADATGNLSTTPVTVYGNGRLIDGATSVTLSTDALSAEWFYRDDLATWVRYAPLVTTDTFPFPEKFDDYFIIMLAIRINPSYGTSIDGQTEKTLRRSSNQLKATYSQITRVNSEIALTRLSKMAWDRDRWQNTYIFPTARFLSGRPY